MKGTSRRDFIKIAANGGVYVWKDGLEARVRRVADIVEKNGGYANP